MNDQTVYAALGSVVVAGVVAFVVGSAALATTFVDVWAGVAVGGLTTAAFAAMALWGMALHDDSAGDF